MTAAAAGAALLLAGCSTSPLTPEDPVESAPDAEPHAVSIEDCVIGAWQVDNASFEGYLNSVAPSTGLRMQVSGASLIRFDGDGAFSSWRDDFTFTMSSGGETVTHVSNSGETGEYGLVLEWGTPPTSNFLWVAETMVVVTDEVMNVGGIATFSDQGGSSSTVDLFTGYRGDVPNAEGRDAVEGSLPFTCSGDTLEFEFDAGQTMPYHRTAAR